jgi:hypothetical protein
MTKGSIELTLRGVTAERGNLDCTRSEASNPPSECTGKVADLISGDIYLLRFPKEGRVEDECARGCCVEVTDKLMVRTGYRAL